MGVACIIYLPNGIDDKGDADVCGGMGDEEKDALEGNDLTEGLRDDVAYVVELSNSG